MKSARQRGRLFKKKGEHTPLAFWFGCRRFMAPQLAPYLTPAPILFEIPLALKVRKFRSLSIHFISNFRRVKIQMTTEDHTDSFDSAHPHESRYLKATGAFFCWLRRLADYRQVVADVGGGTGPYSFWLSSLGYDTHLIEPSIPLVEVCRNRMRADPSQAMPRTVEVGDARSLRLSDASCEAVLMFEPLYHLTERDDRIRALRESRRVLKPGGYIFAATITPVASFIVALCHALVADSAFLSIVEVDIRTGQHRNPTEKISEILRGEAATLTASLLSYDTCAAWSKRHNEKANPKESFCEGDSASAPSEAWCQAH